MPLPGPWLASLLCSALLLAATFPCPSAAAAAKPEMEHHHHHAAAPRHEGAPPGHEPPTLSAPCPCGCDHAGAAPAGSGGGRLGSALPARALPAPASHGALPLAGEPLRLPAPPCLVLDPIPI
jgi:hypothetical protein